MNYKLVATQVGDLLKYDTTVNEINRAAQSIFSFSQESFLNDSITSVRAKEFYDWVLTLRKQDMDPDHRNRLLVQFVSVISPEQYEEAIEKILKAAQINNGSGQVSEEFLARNYHELIHKHSRELFGQGNYFHAVFEAAKVYNKLVQQKSNSEKDGQSLMLDVLSITGVLKLNNGATQTRRNVQEGVKFLSAGLMQAMRNPAAHEPALDWPISKEDCLDMLSFVSYLLRQIDKAVYFKIRNDA